MRGLSYGLATFVLLALLYLRAPYLYDADSYLHLAVSRLYTEQGFVEGLPWPRFSVMHERYGDKELLFHVALMPFVATGDAATGGRLALAAFDALVLTVLGVLASRRLGWPGWLVPWWTFVAAPPWNDRLMRLRPEMLALALLLVAAELVVRRRWAWLALTAALFALSYTAFHLLVGLVVLFTIALLLADRKVEWRPLVATLAGTAAGLAVRPRPAHPEFGAFDQPDVEPDRRFAGEAEGLENPAVERKYAGHVGVLVADHDFDQSAVRVAAHTGMTPCFFQGRSTFLLADMRRPLMIT